MAERYQIHWVSNIGTTIEKDGFIYGNNKLNLEKEAVNILKREMTTKKQTGRYFLSDLSITINHGLIKERILK